ncbi:MULTISPECIES: ornithine cyclodeaminase [Microvirgula]|uniref:Ornithine cyclodeaminase n=1 Tax=Microvirgula aerodenitrificans TaxID=57480 RepID=A0A2S0PCS9_9NEIS|nr:MULTISPECIES: ornithine cyclodeaminase [Microvirgula]AVY95190.1 ornithine cyclodeaminase [Microvirgula aerodenitrificans]RAS15057.1 ornithine cyclodeaminase [Microvirgula sp. AG722]
MTRYIDVNDLKRLLASTGVEPFMLGLVDYIESDYRRWDEFQKSARVANHSPDGVIELMPAADRQLYGFKYVNGHPKNTAQNLLTVMAFGVLADVDTGFPLLLSEFTIATALRTAATSALVARALARPDARTMAVIGNGAQSEFQILAFRALLGINEVRVFDTDPAATAKLIRNLSGVPGLHLTPAASTADAVRGADIVTTATADKALATILTPDMIEPGMHINAVGGDCPGKTELHPDILARARVVVEFEPQTRIEGDIQQMPVDFPVVELWQVLTGAVPGRENAEQVTVFDSVGFALEDFSMLRYLHDLARERNIGSVIDLVPAPDDPKDLYGFMQTAAAG